MNTVIYYLVLPQVHNNLLIRTTVNVSLSLFLDFGETHPKIKESQEEECRDKYYVQAYKRAEC